MEILPINFLNLFLSLLMPSEGGKKLAVYYSFFSLFWGILSISASTPQVSYCGVSWIRVLHSSQALPSSLGKLLAFPTSKSMEWSWFPTLTLGWLYDWLFSQHVSIFSMCISVIITKETLRRIKTSSERRLCPAAVQKRNISSKGCQALIL